MKNNSNKSNHKPAHIIISPIMYTNTLPQYHTHNVTLCIKTMIKPFSRSYFPPSISIFITHHTRHSVLLCSVIFSVSSSSSSVETSVRLVGWFCFSTWHFCSSLKFVCELVLVTSRFVFFSLLRFRFLFQYELDPHLLLLFPFFHTLSRCINYIDQAFSFSRFFLFSFLFNNIMNFLFYFRKTEKCVYFLSVLHIRVTVSI